MNYTGNKYKLLPKLYEYFPKDVDCFLDLFCGGCDVCGNFSSSVPMKIYANDINYHVIEIYEYFQCHSMEYVLDYIDSCIGKYGLSKTNEKGFKQFREDYNKSVKSPIDLFILMCYSFNNQMRFNNKHDYNSSFGRNKSEFNDNIRNNLIEFTRTIGKIKFFKQDFADFDFSLLNNDNYSNCFVYADPPYSLGCATYNDGKRGFRGWHSSDDIMLFNILDRLSSYGVKFALSNVIEHKGQVNGLLTEWVMSNRYNVIPINYNYDNCNYQAKNKNHTTKEVLITNY